MNANGVLKLFGFPHRGRYLAAVTAATLVVVVGVRLVLDYRRRRRNFRAKSEWVRRYVVREGKGRLLNQPEAKFVMRRHIGEGVDANVLFIESSVRPIDAALLSAAAARVAAKHPVLRSRVSSMENRAFVNDVDDDELVFFMEEIPGFRLEVETSMSDWTTAFHEAVHRPFDQEDGPLWRLLLLPSKKEDDKYENVVVATFWHLIVDGLSIMRIVDELLEAMKEIVIADETGETLPEVISLRQSPPITESLPQHLVDPPLYERILVYLMLKLFGKFPLQNFVNCSMIKATKNERSKLRSPGRTWLIPIQLNEEDLQNLLLLCKKFRCKLHGALDAAFHLALSATIAECGNNVDHAASLEINSIYTINSNHLVTRQPDEEYLGDHSSFNIRKKTLRSRDRNEKNFWSLAKYFHDEIHGRLRRHPFSWEMGFLEFIYRLFPAFHRRWRADPSGERDPGVLAFFDYALSNRGSCDFMRKPKPRPFELKSTFYGVYLSGVGMVFNNYVVTVAGKLCWSFSYCDDYVTKETAEMCAANLTRILKSVVE